MFFHTDTVKVRRILLDTNFLVSPFQLGINLFDELDRLYPAGEVYTLSSVLQEAKSIESGKYSDLVDKLVETQDIQVIEAENAEDVDDLLVDLSRSFVIATNDRELRERLDEMSREIVMIRSEKHLVVQNREGIL